MKIIRNLSFLFLAALTLVMGCAEADKVYDEVIEGTTRGAILRTNELISNELPIGVADAGFAVELEVQDVESGDLLDNLDVYIGFRDNTVEDGDPDLDVPQALFGNIPASEFAIGEFGLPRTTFEVSLDEMLSFTGVDEADLFGGDQFEVRFVLNLTDGRSFSNDDNSGTLTGSFFSSPFLYTPTVICPVTEEQFVGDYLLVTAPDSPVGGTPVWNEQVVTLSIGETSTQRVFSAVYLEDLGIGNGASEFVFDLICGGVSVPSGQASGLQCSAGITLGPPVGGEAPGTYDPADDSSFTIVFAEDESNDCGAGTPNITATLTKQ